MISISPGSMLALAIVLMDLCIILVILRIIGRHLHKPGAKRSGLGKDDIFIVISLILFIAICINMITAVAYGRWGVPLEEAKLDPYSPLGIMLTPAYVQSIQFTFVHELILPVQLAFAKLSILLFYRRVLCIERTGPLYWAIVVTGALTTLWGISMFFLFLFQCGPNVSDNWNADPLVEADKCAPATIELAMGASDFCLDLAILLLPMWRLYTLQIALRKKILVIGVFTTGSLSVAASFVRFYMYLAALHVIDTPFDQMNPNLVVSMAMFWSILESGFAIIAACLPNVKIVVDLGISKLRESRWVQNLPRSWSSDSLAPREHSLKEID